MKKETKQITEAFDKWIERLGHTRESIAIFLGYKALNTMYCSTKWKNGRLQKDFCALCDIVSNLPKQ